MEKKDVLAIRKVFEQIKIKTSDGKMHTPTISVKLDNDVWMDDSIHELFWDDANEICYYYHYNQLRGTVPYMIGKDHIAVPAILAAFDYGEIQEMRILLSKDAIISSFDAIESSGAKARVDGQEVTLNDKLKQKILDKYVYQTTPGMDRNELEWNDPYK